MPHTHIMLAYLKLFPCLKQHKTLFLLVAVLECAVCLPVDTASLLQTVVVGQRLLKLRIAHPYLQPLTSLYHDRSHTQGDHSPQYVRFHNFSSKASIYCLMLWSPVNSRCFTLLLTGQVAVCGYPWINICRYLSDLTDNGICVLGNITVRWNWFRFSWLFFDKFGIPWLFQVFQVSVHPIYCTSSHHGDVSCKLLYMFTFTFTTMYNGQSTYSTTRQFNNFYVSQKPCLLLHTLNNINWNFDSIMFTFLMTVTLSPNEYFAIFNLHSMSGLL